MNDVETLRAKLKGLKRISDPLQEERVRRAKSGFLQMVEIYFSHHVRFPETSFFRKEFYKNADKLTRKNRNLLFKAYRGAAKTTLISRLYTIYKTAVKQEKRNAIITLSSSRTPSLLVKRRLNLSETNLRKTSFL